MHDPNRLQTREELLPELKQLEKAADDAYRNYVNIQRSLLEVRARMEKLGDGEVPIDADGQRAED